jgi:hypothetical protein
MSGCSKQAWLIKGKMPRNPSHKRGSQKSFHSANEDFSIKILKTFVCFIEYATCFIEYATRSGLKDFMALGLKGASAGSLKSAPKYSQDFDFLEFSFFKCYQIQKWMSSKMNTFARSKDPDPTGSGLEKL